MKIRIAGIENDSIVDGTGLRMTIFTQGCPHHCDGCHNPETWDFDGGKITDTEEIVQMMKENPVLSGITLSGGEPFAQSDACADLACKAHELGLNVWCYTGFQYEIIAQFEERLVKELLREVDVLVDGRFEKGKRSLDMLFRGSTNQRIIDMNETRKNGKIVLLKV